ncbi:hypothetical protein D3C75_554560 [compost metagenome]
MEVNDNASLLNKRVALKSIASELTPTGSEFVQRDFQVGHAVVLGRRQVPRPHIHLDRRQ